MYEGIYCTVPEILGFLIKSHSAPLYELSSKNSKKDLPGTNGFQHIVSPECPIA